MKKTIALALTASVLFFASCSKKTESEETAATDEHAGHDHSATTDATAEVAEETAAAVSTDDVASADNTVAELTIKGGDDMKYDLTTLKVKAGQKVKLTLVHSGKIPKESMGHNWVLLKNGVSEADFSAKALSAKDNDYIPAASSGDVIAHTKMIGGGESTTIEFTAPARGAYSYICTFPGHSALMKGKLIVQ